MNKKTIFLLAIFSLFLVSFVSAKDPVWIEAPDSIETHKPVEITVHIEDPLVHKYAKNIYIRTNGGGVQWYPKGETEMHYDTDYKGQKEITFVVWGIYDDYYEDNTLNFTVAFYSDAETLQNDFDPGEMYQNHYAVSTVSKLIEVLPLDVSADFPDNPDCVPSVNVQPEGVYGASCRYTGDEEIPSVWSESRTIYRHACIPGNFHLDGNYVGCYYTKKSSQGEFQDEWRYAKNQSYSWSVQGDGPGNTEGFMRSSYQIQQYQYKTEEEDTEDEVKKHLTYLTVNFYQKSGWLDYQGSVTRSMWLEKDEVPGELQSLVSDTKSFVGSASFIKQGSLDPNKNYKSLYTNFLGEPEQITEGLYVYGYITDVDKNPLPYMLVEVAAKDKKYEGYTDLNGNYEIELEDLKLKEDEEINATVFFLFNYFKDEENYFRNYFWNGNTYKGAYVAQDVLVTPEQHGELNLVLDGNENKKLKSNLGTYSRIKDHGVIYRRMHEAVEFYTERLHQKLDHKLPVEVLVGKRDKETLYSPERSVIKIARSDESSLSSNNPKNREYHEFSHHVMFDKYGDWPKGAYDRKSINHNGYLNPNTADSYLEGFAEFMAMVIAKYHGDEKADEYAGFGTMEDNYEPWGDNGYDEEFAVASLLWDMYDKNNEEGDSLSMTLDDIWRVLAVKRDDFYEYYKAFKARYPDKVAAIDEVFKLHGFFYDTREGDGKYQSYEPGVDKNKNGKMEKGEFVDLSMHPKNLTYEKGFTIGKATNYDRKSRTQAVMLEDAFLKVDPEGPRFYRITVDYEDGREASYVVERRQDRIYVHPRPDKVGSTFIIEPETEDFSFEEKFEIKNSDLKEQMFSNAGNGYFAEHDFVLKNLGTNKDPVLFEEDFEPSFTTDENFGEDINEKIENSRKDRKFNFKGLLFTFLLIGGAGLFVYKYITSEKTRKKTHKTLKKTGKKIGEVHHKVKTKHIPKMKKKAKKAHNTFKKKHLPKIKKAAKNTKKKILKTTKKTQKKHMRKKKD